MALAQIGMARREIVVMVMRQRGDLNPCGQSPMDFESITLATRSHCLGGKGVMTVNTDDNDGVLSRRVLARI